MTAVMEQPKTNNDIRITDTGAQKALEIMSKNGKEHAAVRVFVKSGGCSGYSYGMAIDDRTLEGDSMFESNGVRIVVDRASLPFVQGALVDYLETMMGGGFSVVENPNATSNCGCGHSFRTDGASAPEAEGASACH
jgi:iron-sulfur cluster assembly protein